MIKSRLLQQIERDIVAADSPLQAAGLYARRAALLARQGQLDGAREQLIVLHTQAFQHPGPRVGAWLHLAEGLMSYYTDFSLSAAQNKIERALAMAQVAGLPEVEAAGLSWLTHLAYASRDLPAFALLAVQAQAQIAPHFHAARARLSMVIGLAHHYANRADQAEPWYAQVRLHATAEGDDAMLSALIYNRAEMRTGQARREALSGSTSSRPELLLGADSVMHFDAAVGGLAMEALTPILRAQVLVLQDEFEAALKLYEVHLPRVVSKGLARLSSSLMADLAWCRVRTGQLDAARHQAHEAELEFEPTQNVDDRAATHGRLALVYTALGEPERAASHAGQARAAWAEFARQQAQWAAALSVPPLLRPSLENQNKAMLSLRRY